MPRYLIGVVIAVAAMIGLVGVSTGGFGLAHTESSALAQAPTPTPQAGGPSPGHPLPPELAFLRGMTAEQRFDAFVGAQLTLRTPQGQDVIVNAVPGRVASLARSTVTVTPNQSSQTRTFNVTATTRIVGLPRPGSLTVFSPGDRVVVYAVGNSSDALAIVEPRSATEVMHHVLGHPGPMTESTGDSP